MEVSKQPNALALQTTELNNNLFGESKTKKITSLPYHAIAFNDGAPLSFLQKL